MNHHLIQLNPALVLGAALLLTLQAAPSQTPVPSPLFTQKSSDPSFAELLEMGIVPKAKNSKAGVTGSTIHVNQKLVEAMPEARRPIPQDIKVHTLLSSVIPRKDFKNWSRWYQEDGHTQIFRLFKGEMNRHNDRPLSARSENFSQINWTEAQGAWHEWSGVVTAINPIGSILQVKALEEGPAVMLLMSQDGTVKLNHRRGVDKVIATGMIGKSFLLRVRDNGRNYEVYFNGEKVGEGSYARPKGKNNFRWGMYVGEHEVIHDAMIFFSGVTLDGKPTR